MTILSRFLGRKTETNVLNYREEVLKKIKEGDSWDECLSLSKEHISNQLDWISDRLVLTSVKMSGNDEYYFREIQNRRGRRGRNGLLTGRQETCFFACVALTNEDRVNEAYHEFYDFIDDYRRKGIFSSEVEIKGIKLMVDIMQNKISAL